ncbi:DUF3971 domain-containing protein [Roseomonas xinghualingensis]|uniref:DUF3971 domain-containing protein n=1 Tax=Roseomonas xinghualingensis TaxID=2986475 RepID=UPI0021F23264|nr:DUF3971 domain-containing protein [Roseomonas sp. SXEYE001]
MAIPSIPPLNEELARRLAGMAPGLKISFGQAYVAWEGWKDGAPQPLFLRMDGLRAVDGAGAVRASLTSTEVSVAVPPLLRGVVAPVRVLLREPVVLLRRDMEGELSLDLGFSPGPGAPPEGSETAEPSLGDAGPEAQTETLARLLGPPHPDSPFAALREARLEGGMIQVRDEPLQLAWAMHHVALSVTRAEDGAITLAGSADLRLSGQEIPVRISGRSAGQPPVAEMVLEIDDISPPALATALPSLRPLEMLDSRLSARFSGRYDFGDGQFAGRAEVRSSPGRIARAEGRTPFDEMTIVLTGDGRRIELERLALRLPAGSPDAPASRLTATGRADRHDGMWRGRLEIGLDAMAVPDIGRYWPPDVAKGGREWVTNNLTAGMARDGHWFLEGEAPADFSTGRVTDAGGSVRAEGVTVHWLRPIPPLEGANGLVTFSMKDIVIQASAERQAGTALTVPEARVRLYDLSGADVEKAEIDGRVTGPLNDVLNLVRHPRLHLFKNRPLELGQVSGSVDARLSIGLPLLNDLPMEDLRISVQGKVVNGRIANVVAGQPVQRAQLDVSVDTAGMRVAGTAQLGPIPGRVQAELDFQSGPPSQVLERIQLEGRARVQDFRRLGVDLAPFVTGAMGYSVQAERRRSRDTRVAVRTDLRAARLALEPLNYTKASGAPASAQAVVRLRGENLTAVEDIRVEGPDLMVRGGVAFRSASNLDKAELLEVRIGPSRFTGTVNSPARPGEPWEVRARGAMLDARGLLRDFGQSGNDGRAGERSGDSMPLRADVAFGRVQLAENRVLAPVQASLFIDAAGVLRELRASGRGVSGGGFEAVVVPRGAGRAMEARADGFGTMLRDLGIFDGLSGGALHMSGTWPGNAPNSPLSGVVELRDFGVMEAAGIGKFLQALSIYGIPEAIQGPGLRFTLLNAPFTLTPQALTLTEARAVSASLGITAEGRILLQQERINMRGTVVPSYALNSALGRIPGIGRLFTAERGGGLFAANFRVTGKLDDPDVQLDPLSLLAPGALRGLLTRPGG